MKKLPALLIIASLLLGGGEVFAASGGGPRCEKDGVEYGVVKGNFREEWYCYQERGESYLAGGCYEFALADFERAIQLRTALDRSAETPGCDQRRARTYGMHFVDWFGHRNRGIALYELGRIDEAIKELEFSLHCTESSQAQFYLDKARQANLKSSGGDLEAPQIKSVRLLKSRPRIDYTKDEFPQPASGYDRYLAVPYYFTEDEVKTLTQGLNRRQRKKLGLTPGWGHQVISWKAADEVESEFVKESRFYLLVESSDDQGVQTVASAEILSPYTFAQKQRADVFSLALPAGLAGDEVKPEDLETQDLFTITLSGTQGKAGLNLTVTDLVGKTASHLLSPVIDRQGPQIDLDRLEEKKGAGIKIQGRWHDASGLQKFTIEGKAPTLLGEDRFEVELPQGTGPRLRFEAMDRAGNVTTGAIITGTESQGTWLQLPPLPAPSWARSLPSPLLLAQHELLPSSLPSRLPLNAPWNLSPPSSVPLFLPQRGPLLLGEVELYWQGETGETDAGPKIILKTKQQTVYSDELYLEGSAASRGAVLTELRINNQNVLAGTPKTTFFNQLLSLSPGKNIITIRAVDEKGRAAEEKLTITRVVPKVHTVSQRLGVSMLPFYLVEPVREISEVAYDNLAAAFIEQRRFNLVDRSQVEAAVREMNLSGYGLTEPSTAVGAGARTFAEAVIIGVVKETATSIEVKAQVVDVESARVMVTRDAFHQDKSLKNLAFITRGLAAKIQNDFPLVQGEIMESQGNNMTVSLGRKNRMLPGMRVVIFQLVPQTDPAGNPVGADTKEIGYGAITDVSSTSSVVRVTTTQSAPSPRDLVITK